MIFQPESSDWPWRLEGVAGWGGGISPPLSLGKPSCFAAGSGFISRFRLPMLMLIFIGRILEMEAGLMFSPQNDLLTSAREFKVQDAVIE